MPNKPYRIEMKRMKKLRVGISIITILLFTFLFSDVHNFITRPFANTLTFLQFTPSLLRFIQVAGAASIGFFVVLILTILWGRIYCSWICPLGIFQDVISFLSNKIKLKKHRRYTFKKAWTITRFSILGIVTVLFLFGYLIGLNLLDPFSVFGKITTNLLQPIVALANNILVSILEWFSIYLIFPVENTFVRLEALIFPSVMLILVMGLSFWRGRLYCNTICPVGTLLGLVSKISVFKLKINQSACTLCGNCISVCKSECIDIAKKEIDFSRCVGCFNCVDSCSQNGIHYQKREIKKASTAETDVSKRTFFTQSSLYLAGFFGLSARTGNGGGLRYTEKDNSPVTPPGSYRLDEFKDKCTACHLCVSVCPEHVIQPSFLEYGFTGMNLPLLDFNKGYCVQECNLCTQVCPTDALKPLSPAEKETLKIGSVEFRRGRCVVVKEKTACGACSEHCPTQAVKMVPYGDNGLTIPETKDSICIGCGACEYACPAEPHKAITVRALQMHQKAVKPKIEDIEKSSESTDDFPF